MAPKNKKNAPKTAGKPKYNEYVVKEPAELMDFLMNTLAGISRTTAKSLLSHRQVMVDKLITTLYNYPLKPGMVVRISKEKGRKEFTNPHVRIIYEDGYLLVVEKKAGILSTTPAGKKEASVFTILTDYIKRSGKQRRIFHINQLEKEASGLMIFAKDEKNPVYFPGSLAGIG
ncbi:MAG: pseudouridine synthase [Bacteroides sp.]|nr:pseudouridine synthase [Bacteroides sp.]